MKGVSILRRLVSTRPSIITRSSSSPLVETLTLSSAAATASYFTLILSDELRKPQFHFDIATKTSAHLSGLPINYRNFSSDSASGQSKMVSIETEKQLNDSLMKAEASHDSVPSIFYFTAAWCGPCKFLSPIIGQLSEKYPHVTTYKVDIDKEDLGLALSKLNITAVPTVYFFKDGKKASAVVGADANQLSATMEELYK